VIDADDDPFTIGPVPTSEVGPLTRRAADPPRDWSAESYHRQSDWQLEMGREVLDRLALRGDETVLDAGCGTGRVTRELLERLPRGRVIAVDASPAMVERARAELGDRAEVLVADLAELELPEPVDAIVSTAVFHWIPDTARLFGRLHAALVPGGRLEAQSGGDGNISRVRDALALVTAREPFAEHLAGWPGPWTFRSPVSAAAALQEAGFTDIRAWLEARPVTPDEPEEYLRTVTLGSHLERLPAEHHDAFVSAVAAELPVPPEMDYVRLNLSARRPGGGPPGGDGATDFAPQADEDAGAQPSNGAG
jgi:trans-aconitate 2-methyltransferase